MAVGRSNVSLDEVVLKWADLRLHGCICTCMTLVFAGGGWAGDGVVRGAGRVLLEGLGRCCDRGSAWCCEMAWARCCERGLGHALFEGMGMCAHQEECGQMALFPTPFSLLEHILRSWLGAIKGGTGGGGGGIFAPSQIRGGKFRCGPFRGAPRILCGTPRQSPQCVLLVCEICRKNAAKGQSCAVKVVDASADLDPSLKLGTGRGICTPEYVSLTSGEGTG